MSLPAKIVEILFMLCAAIGASAAPQTEAWLPAVPDSLRTPASRAQFLAAHLWDNADLSAPAPLIEQHFADFVAILNICDAEADFSQPFNNLIDKAIANGDAIDAIANLADLYLYDDASPYRNEELYRSFLTSYIARADIDEYRKAIPRERLREIDTNAPGTIAADFEMTAPDGSTFSLSSTLGAPFTILIFFHSDCDDCSALFADIAADSAIESLIDYGSVQIVAVDLLGDSDAFLAKWAQLPTVWTVAQATQSIEDTNLYILPSFPTIYLLDSTGTILLKNTTLPAAKSLIH